jgi:hypothetical protein
MKFFVFPAMILAASLACGCASKPKVPPPIELQGFSVAPPVEEGWAIARQTPTQVIFGKPGRFTGETLAIQATVIGLPAFQNGEDLLKYAESAQRREFAAARFRILSLTARPQDVQGESCAMVHLEVAERGSAEGTGSPVNTMLELLALTCAHPQDRRRGISHLYSHRHFPEDKDPQFEEAGVSLLGNLRFGAL